MKITPELNDLLQPTAFVAEIEEQGYGRHYLRVLPGDFNAQFNPDGTLTAASIQALKSHVSLTWTAQKEARADEKARREKINLLSVPLTPADIGISAQALPLEASEAPK